MGEGARLGLFALILLATPTFAASTWTPSGADLIYTSTKYTLDVDAKTAAPKSIAISGKPIVNFGQAGWWRATFEDGSIVDSTQTPVTLTQSAGDLVCKYTSDKISVQLRITPAADHVDLRAYITPTNAVITRFALPQSLEFSPDSINEVDYPEELGRALKPAFFKPQPDSYAHWTTQSLGEQGAIDVGVSPAQMLDYDSDAVPATVTDQGKVWLGDAPDLGGWIIKNPRPPKDTPDATLIDTPNGPLLSMQTVDGGWGWFIRWAGLFDQADQAKQINTTRTLLDRLWSIDAPGGFKIHPPLASRDRPLKDSMPPMIGIVCLSHNQDQINKWMNLGSVGNCSAKVIFTPDSLMTTLKSHDCWAIVNVDTETLPSTAADEKSTAAAIRNYIANGGVWVHTGAAPFYYTAALQPYNTLEGDYPPLFSDFMHIDSKVGQLSVYGIQQLPPWRGGLGRGSLAPTPPLLGAGGQATAGAGFIPAHLDVTASDAGGRIGRAWITWIDKGQAPGGRLPQGTTATGWTSPIARIAIGQPVDTSIRAYGIANGFTTPLASKVKPAVLAKLKQSLLINYAGNSYKDEAAGISKLPSPSLIHVWDYLHGGFDKQYPDHLPPNPNHGTPDEFAGVIAATHAAGDLFMPYTNPTWWCDGPPGPTLVEQGHAPLLVDRKGNNKKEVYGKNFGWSLCTFHPAAIAAEASILSSFTKDYPVDVLFQDQIGARGPAYDFNPAAPNPDSYTEGMRDIALRDSKSVPLGTENGFDAVMNPETQFCGVCWGLVPTQYQPEWVHLWRIRFAQGTWDFAPLALWLAHDKNIFTMHDLGQFVTNRETLAWTTVLGYELSARTSTNQLAAHPEDTWLPWLAALQKTFGPSIIGQPLTSWEELQPNLYRARYGSTTVTSNTTNAPVDIDARTSLPPFGFLIVDPVHKTLGGSVTKQDGKPYPAGLDFIDIAGKRSTFTLDR